MSAVSATSTRVALPGRPGSKLPAGPIPESGPSSQRDWTVLIFQGNGCFQKFDEHQMDLGELAELPSSDKVTFVSQGHIDYHDDVLVRREIEGAKSREVGRVEGARQNQPEQLADFLAWGMEAYPAERYCLVISGHGGGWNGLISDKRDGLAQLPALAQSLEDGLRSSARNLDVLALDAHWMACGEAAAEFSQCADFLVASQGRMNSWDYRHSFAGLVSTPGQTGLDLTRMLVAADTTGSRMTGLDLGQADRLAASTRDFVKAVGSQAWNGSHFKGGMRCYHFYDLGLVGEAFQSADYPESLRKTARDLSASVRAIIVDQSEGRDGKTAGLNVSDMHNEQTASQRFHAKSGWSEMIDSIE